MLHTAASRVGALDLGFVREGPRHGGILDGAQKGEIDFVYLLGADEFDIGQARHAPSSSIRARHGDAGAHRADVVLPGAAYTEKDGLYVNTEGRVQRANRATFPPGEAKEDWAILRALSDVLGKRLPYDDLDAAARAIIADAPHFADVDTAPAHPGADPAIWNAIGAAGRSMRRAARIADRRFLSHQPDRARERDHGRMQPRASSTRRQTRWRRSRRCSSISPLPASRSCPTPGRGR